MGRSVYVDAVDDVLTAYALSNDALVLGLAACSRPFGHLGAAPSVSADGATGGIVWEIEHSGSRTQPGAAVLHAYNAAKVGQELYSSAMAGARDLAGAAVKFTVPTIANGKVYVGTQTGVTVYGLLGE